MDVVVLMDGPQTVVPETDTSFALIVAAEERGHRVWHCEAAHVGMAGGTVTARACPARAEPTAAPPLALGETELVDLADVDVVLIRTDPPFDATYLHLTLLLDLIADRTLVVNAPRGLRDANEKLYALRFPEIIPPTIVSADADELAAFAAAHGAAVLKPIEGHGGRGVMVLDPADHNGPCEAT